MDRDYWIKKWEASDTRFHKNEVNPNLLKFHKRLPQGGTVFVPLCGKSLDMDWLETQGHKVVGVEISSVACRAFFEENKRTFDISERDGFKIFKGKNITLLSGDFFELSANAIEGVTSVFDRAALVALPPELRRVYAQKLRLMFEKIPNLQFLLVTTEYSQTLVQGPPFSVLESEVRTLFSDWLDITLLSRQEDVDLKYGHPKFKGISNISECVFGMKGATGRRGSSTLNVFKS